MLIEEKSCVKFIKSEKNNQKLSCETVVKLLY